jgi:hypothetical protein
MNYLLTALASKFSGSAFSTDVSGRHYLDAYPPDEMPPTYPYCVYFIVSGIPDDVFAKKGRSLLIQFSLFSASAGATEITTMYNDLHSLFDDCSFTITSNTLFWMHEQNLVTMVDDATVNDATQRVKHWAADYEIVTQAS